MLTIPTLQEENPRIKAQSRLKCFVIVFSKLDAAVHVLITINIPPVTKTATSVISAHDFQIYSVLHESQSN